MKKYLILSLVAVMSLISLAPAMARGNDEKEGKNNEDRKSEVRANIEIKKELKLEIKEERKEMKDRIKDLRQTKRFAPRALNLTGKLVSVNSTSTSSTEITVNITRVSPGKPRKTSTSTVIYPEVGKNLVLKISDKTSLIKAWGGKMKISDMSAGDEMHIVVKFSADGSLDVRVVKDNSLHILRNKKGIVESINASISSFVLKQEKRTLTVKTDANTKFKLRGSTSTSFADIKVGDKVTVSGIVNTNLNTVNAASVLIKKPAVSVSTSISSTISL